MTGKVEWSAEDLAEFDRITRMMSSPDQMDRINGRSEINGFIAKHGKEKCDAMFEHLTGKKA